MMNRLFELTSGSSFLGVLSVDEICENIKQGKGRDLIVINLADNVNYVKYFVIVTANSYRHLRVS